MYVYFSYTKQNFPKKLKKYLKGPNSENVIKLYLTEKNPFFCHMTCHIVNSCNFTDKIKEIQIWLFFSNAGNFLSKNAWPWTSKCNRLEASTCISLIVMIFCIFFLKSKQNVIMYIFIQKCIYYGPKKHLNIKIWGQRFKFPHIFV